MDKIIRRLLDSIAEYDGQALHLYLEHGDTADEHIQYARDYAKRIGDTHGVRLAGTLLSVSEDVRIRVLDILDGDEPFDG